MKTQTKIDPELGQTEGGGLTQELRRIREACEHSDSDTGTGSSVSTSDTGSVQTEPIFSQVLDRPPLVKQYYNRELRKWLPISLGPSIARQAVLGEEGEGEDGKRDWHQPGGHSNEGDERQSVNSGPLCDFSYFAACSIS